MGNNTTYIKRLIKRLKQKKIAMDKQILFTK